MPLFLNIFSLQRRIVHPLKGVQFACSVSSLEQEMSFRNRPESNNLFPKMKGFRIKHKIVIYLDQQLCSNFLSLMDYFFFLPYFLALTPSVMRPHFLSLFFLGLGT